MPDLLAGIEKHLENINNRYADIQLRVGAVEQRVDSKAFPVGDSYGESIGEQLIKSDGFRAVANGARDSGKIRIKTALINPSLGSSTLVQADRRGILPGISRRLRLRDVIPSFPTTSNAIEFPKESSFTNAAAVQYSAGQYENVPKAESALAFNLSNVPVTTLAHFLPVSKQLLDDAPGLAAYVNQRLLYGLRLKEESEVLSGSGLQGHLSGLITNATAFDYATYAPESDATYMDTLRKAALQMTVAELNPDVCVVSPIDWDVITGTKESGTGISSGQYIVSNPAFMPRTQLWGMDVVVSNSMSSGTFLILDSQVAAAIFDRQDATVEISREHSDFFVRNMACVLVESRLALAVFRAEAIVYGSFPFGS